jgi:hypothetical protein
MTVPETVMRLLLGDWAAVATRRKITNPNTDKTGTLIRTLLLTLRDEAGCCGDVQLKWRLLRREKGSRFFGTGGDDERPALSFRLF